MALQPGQDIELETYPDTNQFIRIAGGQGKAVIGDRTYDLVDGRDIFVPAGYEHNVINTSPDALLKLYVIYTPPKYPDGTIHKTKAEAQAADHHNGTGKPHMPDDPVTS